MVLALSKRFLDNQQLGFILFLFRSFFHISFSVLSSAEKVPMSSGVDLLILRMVERF